MSTAQHTDANPSGIITLNFVNLDTVGCVDWTYLKRNMENLFSMFASPGSGFPTEEFHLIPRPYISWSSKIGLIGGVKE